MTHGYSRSRVSQIRHTVEATGRLLAEIDAADDWRERDGHAVRLADVIHTVGRLFWSVCDGILDDVGCINVCQLVDNLATPAARF